MSQLSEGLLSQIQSSLGKTPANNATLVAIRPISDHYFGISSPIVIHKTSSPVATPTGAGNLQNVNTPLSTSAPVATPAGTISIPMSSSAPSPVSDPVLSEVAAAPPILGTDIPNTAAAGLAGSIFAGGTTGTWFEII